MSAIHSMKDFTSLSILGKISIIGLFLLPVVGVCCIIFPEPISDHLPYILGSLMILVGLADIVNVIRKKSLSANKTGVGTSFVLCVLGIVAIIDGRNATNFIGVMWGLLGLYKAAGNFTAFLEQVTGKKATFLLPLLSGILQLVLAILLILNPFANIEHHVILLGIELIIYPFKLYRKDGKIKIEADS